MFYYRSNKKEGIIVKASIKKNIEIESILPDEIENYPWSGHLGLKLIDKVIPIIHQSRTTLIFINTRGMSETWYQLLLTTSPDLAGVIALHHGSIDMELRTWVEEALHEGKLKAVVARQVWIWELIFARWKLLYKLVRQKALRDFYNAQEEAVISREK